MYKHILFAIEFGKETDVAINKLKELVDLCDKPMVTLMHVIELPPYDIYPDIPQEEKEAEYIQHATRQLEAIGKKLNVPISKQYVEIGDPKERIPDFMEQNQVDLLIVGHHKRHGIYRLLGSTAYALLCHAKCQVLIFPCKSY